MKILAVVPHRHWLHVPTGRTASVYGANPCPGCPATSEWTVVEEGWTWKMSNGTVGFGRAPAATLEEALAVMARVNAPRTIPAEARW